jgi:hypothetical protein
MKDIHENKLKVKDPILATYGNMLVDAIITKINKRSFDMTYF